MSPILLIQQSNVGKVDLGDIDLNAPNTDSTANAATQVNLFSCSNLLEIGSKFDDKVGS